MNSTKFMKTLPSIGLPILILITQMGCGTSTGNPTIAMQFGTFTAIRPSILDWLIPSAFAAISNTKFCFKRLRFKRETTDTNSQSSNFDFQPGEIQLNSSSVTSLGSIQVSPGLYRRVEFDLANNGSGCTSGNSVTMTNANGSYTTTDTITIKFEGQFVAVYDGQVLNLGLQGIIDAMNTISGASGTNPTIKTTLENTSIKGNF